MLGWEVSRRQFVVIAGGSAAAIAVAGGYIAASDSSPVKTSLWTVRVLRAGRGARLTADGLPASHAVLGPSVFNAHADRTGASRPVNSTLALASIGSSGGHTDDHASGGILPATPYPQPMNRTWGDVVVLELEVLNTAAFPSLFSPGQLRLKLANGPTITPQDASRGPHAIAAGAGELLWVSYLAPSDAADFAVEFTDPRGDAHLALRVPGLVAAKAQS